MKVFIDSHSMIWALDDPAKLSAAAAAALQDPANELIVSVACPGLRHTGRMLPHRVQSGCARSLA
jgi:hypothetical protein